VHRPYAAAFPLITARDKHWWSHSLLGVTRHTSKIASA